MQCYKISYFLGIINNLNEKNILKRLVMKTIAMIVAAGRGVRAGSNLPKQYELHNKTRMLSFTINALLKSSRVDALIVVINPLDINLYEDSVKDIEDTRILKYCFGGSERTQSVQKGLKAIEKYAPKNVLIHDGARPFIPLDLTNRIIDSLNSSQAVLPVLPIVDAIWEIDSTNSEQSFNPGPNRDKLLLAQTPQGFNYQTICSAYEHSDEQALDDIAIVHRFGVKISTVAGDPRNKKITSQNDLKIFKGKKT